MLEIFNDSDAGGVPCTITSPTGTSEPFNALHSDIHLSFDPGTGQYISGRQVHMSLILSELASAGFGGICAIADKDSKPWLVTVTDILDNELTLRVVSTHPSYSLGNVSLTLELYEVAP